MIEIDRFMSKVDKRESCWVWLGAKDKNGYGFFQAGVKNLVRAHRFSYEAHHGEIPFGAIVLHSCDNPSCVNPKHLNAGTHAENARQREERNRRRIVRGSERTDALLNEQKVAEIRSASGIKQADIAAMYGVSRRAIQKIRNGEMWAHVGASVGSNHGRWPSTATVT